MCSFEPLAVATFCTSTHLLAWVFTRSPAAFSVNFCAPEPLHVHSCTTVPSAVPPPDTSMHLPIAPTEPSALNVHCCAFVPLQSQICSRLPSTALADGMSMQRLLP